MAANLNGKVVAITGGARGIGLETIKHLLAAGASVGAGDIDLNDQTNALEALPGKHAAFALDVTDRESFGAFLDGVESEFGPIDVLVNNAGIMALGPFHEESDQVSLKEMSVNVGGPMIGSKLAIQRMLPRGKGHVINIASSAGRFGLPGHVMYVASKHAVFGMTEAMAAEYGNTPLKFTTICPVVVRTELTDGVNKKARGLPELKPEAVAEAVIQMIEKPKQSIFVPRYVKLVHLMAQISPTFMQKQSMKLMNVDQIMTNYDPESRRDYEAKHFK